MLTCKEVSVLLSQAPERRLGWREKLGLALDLKLCEGCVNFREQLALIRAAVQRYRDNGRPRA